MALIDRKPAVLKKPKLAIPREHYLLVCIVLLSLVLRLLWLKTVIEGDEGIYGYNAMVWLQGHLPYVDLTPTYSKMPLLYLLYLASIYFFGNTIIPVRILNNILFLTSIVILYLIAKDWFGKRVGFVAALFYGIFMNMPVFQAQQAMSESFSVPFVILSIYFCNKYLRNGGKSRLFISGISISAATLIRQTQALGIFVLLFVLTFTRYESFRKSSETKSNFARILTVDALVLSLGILLPALFFIVYFWSHGALDALIECTLLSPAAHYFSSSDVPFGVRFLIFAEGLPLWLFSIFGFIMSTLRHNKRDIFLIGWTLFFLPIIIMPPNFGHHYATIIPQGSILSAVSLVPILYNVIKSRSLKGFLGNCRQNAATIFVIAILIISFVPSVFLQAKQYPNLDIHWEFIDWAYGGDPGPWTYKKQIELGNYLKSNVSESGHILVHGWLVTPYWLSGRRAPSKYVWTVKEPEIFTIPEEEFQKVAAMVKNGTFECIIILSPDLESLEWRRDVDPVIDYDPIVDYTIQKYFYVKNISNAQIFSKYNTNGEYIEYLFMEHFADASKEYKTQYSLFIEHFSDALKEYKTQNGTIGDTEKDFEKQWAFIPKVSWLNVNGDARNAIRQHPIPSAESYIRYNDVSVPPNSKLSFGIAIDPTSWYRQGGDGAEFKIYVENGENVDVVFDKHINPKRNIEERKWNDCEIGLTAHGGKKVNIIFVTTPGPANDNYDDWAYWGVPQIYDEMQNGTIGDTEKDFEEQWALIPEVSVPRMNISGDVRDAIRHHPIPSAESYIRYNNISVPPNSKLRFGIATYPGTWYRREGDGVLFKIYTEDDGKVETLFSKYINPKENMTERKWNDYEVDLSRFGNRNVNIIFVTTPGPNNDNYDDWAYWSAPKIYVKR